MLSESYNTHKVFSFPSSVVCRTTDFLSSLKERPESANFIYSTFLNRATPRCQALFSALATGVSGGGGGGRAAFEKAEAFTGHLCVLSSDCSVLRGTSRGGRSEPRVWRERHVILWLPDQSPLWAGSSRSTASVKRACCLPSARFPYLTRVWSEFRKE